MSNPLGVFPELPLPSATGVGITGHENHGGAINAFAAQSGTHMLGVSWADQAGAGLWTGWLCFDAVPYPRRVAAKALRNGAPEVFVTTECGDLYVRRLLAAGNLYAWSNWAPFGLPSPRSFVTDVALTTSSQLVDHVYVADRGSLYARHRLGADTYAAFSAWESVGLGAQVATAGLRQDGRQQVFVLDNAGRSSSAVQGSSELGASFEAPFDFGSSDVPELVDIEAVNGTTPLDVLGIDEEGELWVRREDGSGNFGPWTGWPGPAPPQELVALAGAALPTIDGAPLVLLALGRTGTTYLVRRVHDVWGPWIVHQ